MKYLKCLNHTLRREHHVRRLCCTMLAAVTVFSALFGISAKAYDVKSEFLLCHCGSRRNAHVYLEYQETYCPMHGANCHDYRKEVERCYYECPNPACNDSFFGNDNPTGKFIHY